jgi:hypothetical protein
MLLHQKKNILHSPINKEYILLSSSEKESLFSDLFVKLNNKKSPEETELLSWMG